MATKQEFYTRVHLNDRLTISVFRFQFPFPLFPIAHKKLHKGILKSSVYSRNSSLGENQEGVGVAR